MVPTTRLTHLSWPLRLLARAAFREAFKIAGSQILEPVMKVEVITPEDYMGDIIGDLNSRRGQVSWYGSTR